MPLTKEDIHMDSTLATVPAGVDDAVGILNLKWFVAIVNSRHEKITAEKLMAVNIESYVAMQVYQFAKGWVNVVKKQFLTIPPADALRLIDSYDIMHRIAFQCSAKAEELDRIKLSAFDAMIYGDKAVDEYIMFRVIRNAVRQRNKAFFDKPLKWSCISEERWHKEAVIGFDRTVLTDYDILSRATILLESDLFVYEGRKQDQFKQNLTEKYSHYLHGYTAPDHRTENALENFRLLSVRYLSVGISEWKRLRTANIPCI